MRTLSEKEREEYDRLIENAEQMTLDFCHMKEPDTEEEAISLFRKLNSEQQSLIIKIMKNFI